MKKAPEKGAERGAGVSLLALLSLTLLATNRGEGAATADAAGSLRRAKPKALRARSLLARA